MSKQAIALKYRPKTFDDLIGQEMIASTLSLALTSGQIAHAYLFSGLRGSGKTSSARILAKTLVCSTPHAAKPCEQCVNCLHAASHKHPDIIELDAASHRGIDDIRDIIEQSQYAPSMGRFKVFIIDEAHMITMQAFNAFLKTLEEPNEHSKFILATTDPLKIPGTILSRTQHFRFKRISQHDIVARVMHILALENVDYDHDAIEALARAGKGSMRDTLTLLDQAIIYCKNNITLSDITAMLGLINPAMLENVFDLILNQDKKTLEQKVQDLIEFETDTLLDEIILFLQDKLFDGASAFTPLFIDRCFRILSECKHLLALNSPPSFVISLMFLKMTEALKVNDIGQMIQKIERHAPAPLQTPPVPSKPDQDLAIKPHDASVNATTTPSTSDHPTATIPPSPPQEEAQKPLTLTPQEHFTKLITTMQKRDPQIAQCFQESITLQSFEQEVLVLGTDIKTQECKGALKVHREQIRQCIKEVFGANVQISFVPQAPRPQVTAPHQVSEDSQNQPSKQTPPSHANQDFEETAISMQDFDAQSISNEVVSAQEIPFADTYAPDPSPDMGPISPSPTTNSQPKESDTNRIQTKAINPVALAKDLFGASDDDVTYFNKG